MYKRPLLFILTFFAIPFWGEAENIDSLRGVYLSNKHDTVKVKALISMCRYFNTEDKFDTLVYYSKKAYELSEKENYKLGKARSLFYIGCAYHGLQLFPTALDYYFKALSIADEIGNKSLQIRLNNQIGIIYSSQKNHKQALKYFMKFAAIAETMKDSSIIAKCYNNVGIEYKNIGKTDISSDYSFRALKIFQRLNDVVGIASCYNNIGILLQIDKQYEASIDYQRKAKELHEKIGNKQGVLISNINIADNYNSLNNPTESIRLLFASLAMADTVTDKMQVRDIYLGLYQSYELLKNTDKAFYYYKKYIAIKDSLFNNEFMQQQQDAENTYRFLSKEKEIDLLKKNEEIKNLELSKNKTQSYILILGVLLAVVVAYLFYLRFKQNQKQNVLLQRHNEEITHQKKEITDSINYAKRIQESILPPDSLVKKLLPDSFVLYKPKDIVSGDFYWIEECDGKIIFASVDCTGHGVPGAMMSVLGFNLLTQAVNEKRLTTPSKILEHLDYGVDKMLRQSAETTTVRDGMDLSLCSLDYATGVLQFAGAYNNLWIVKNATREFMEIKADKKVIGVNVGGQADSFTNHTIQLEKGDTVYIFSDGYADQFGGDKGKKFKYKPLKDLIVSIHRESMDRQKEILDNTIEEWKGNLEQVDDILVIGVRL